MTEIKSYPRGTLMSKEYVTMLTCLFGCCNLVQKLCVVVCVFFTVKVEMR